MPLEKNMLKLQKLLSLMESDGLTEAKFVESFAQVMKMVRDLRASNEREFTLIHSAVQMLSEKVKADASTEMSNSKKGMMDYCEREMAKMQKEMDRMSKTQMDGMNFVYDKANSFKDMEEGKIVQDVLAQIKLPEQEENKLIIDAIKGLRKELDEMKASKSGAGATHAIFASQRGAVKAYDISSQLNGVLKTFTLPAFWRVISVHSSSFPSAFRETTDYTTDANASTITFTSQIDASTALASGNSIIIVYAEI